MNLWRKYVTVTSVAACVSSTAPGSAESAVRARARHQEPKRESHHLSKPPPHQILPNQAMPPPTRAARIRPAVRSCALEGKRAALRGGLHPLWGKAVADAPDRLYPARLLGIGLDHATQPQDGDVDGPVVALAAVVVARQRQQSSRDNGLPALRTSASSRLISPPVSLTTTCSRDGWRVAGSNTKGAEGDGRVAGQRGRTALAAQHGLDARQQFARIEGLADIIIGAGLQADDPVHRLVARSAG